MSTPVACPEPLQDLIPTRRVRGWAEAVGQNGRALASASEALQSDREVVVTAVAQWAASLQFASDAYRADREVVLAAVRQTGYSLRHTSVVLQENCNFQRDPEFLIPRLCS